MNKTPRTVTATTSIVDSIISCASIGFDKLGYKKTTVDDIAVSIHISKKTLYSLFPSKEEILKEVIWRDLRHILKKFNDNIPNYISHGERIVSFCRFVFNDRIKNGKNGLFKLFYKDDPDIYLAYLTELKNLMRDLYDRGRVSGALKATDSILGAEIVVSMMTAAIERYSIATDATYIFNDTLNMITDAISNTQRIPFDKLA